MMLAAAIAIMLFTPNEFYANILPYYMDICIGSIGYVLYIIIQGIRRKKTGSVLILIGTLGFIPAILVDFYADPTYYFIPIGLLFMIVCFSIVVIRNVFLMKLENEYLEEAIMRDPLTGVRNRYYLNMVMDKKLIVPENHKLFILFIDLDRFKLINDTYGHHVGDIILVESAKRFSECLHRESDIVCRYGGDEFVVMLRVRDQEGNIQKIVGRILAKFKEPVIHQDRKYLVSVSIGVSECKTGDNLENIIKESDHAMYQAKKTTPGNIMIFNKM